MDLGNWLGDYEETITKLWLKAVRDKALSHYADLTIEALAEELKPFYHCVMAAIVEEDGQSLASVGDWMLAQRLSRGCNLPELLEISSRLRWAVGRTLSTSLEAGVAIAFWQKINLFFDEASIILTDLFTQAIEETLLERLEEAEFLAGHLAAATAEADQALVRLRAMYDVSRTLGSTLDLEQTLHLIVEKLAAVAEVDHCAIWLPDKRTLTAVAAYGLEEEESDLLHPAPLPPDLAGPSSLVGQAFATGQTVAVSQATEENFREWESERSLLRSFDIESTLAVPLVIQDTTIGVVTLDSHTREDLSTTEAIDLIQSIVHQAAVAIENARLYKETKVRADEMVALYETSLDLASQLDVARLLRSIVERATSLLGAKGGAIYAYDETRDELELTLCYNLDQNLAGLRLKRGEGLSGKILASGQPMIVEDYPAWKGRSEKFTEQTVTSVLGVPLKWGERIVGVINIHHDVARAFSENDLRLLSLFANQAAVAIENARLYAASERRVAELTTLYQLGVQIGAQLDLETLLNQIAHNAAQLLEADAGAILLVDESKGVLTIKGAYGLSEKVVRGTRDRIGESIAGRVVEMGTPIIANNLPNDPYFYNPSAEEEGLLAIISTPMFARNKIIGTLDVHSKTERFAFTEDHLQVLSLLASQAAIAIENAWLYREIRNYSEQLEERVVERTQELAEEKERLESLYSITRELSASLDLDKILDRTLNMVTSAADAEHGVIMLTDPVSGSLVSRAVMGRALPRGGEVTPFRRGVGLAGWVLEQRQSLIVEDVTSDERWLQLPGGRANVRSVLAVPLMVGEDVHGVLIISDCRVGHFTEAHLKLVSTAATQVATAINNAELYRFVSDQAERLGEMLRSQREEASKSQAILESIADGVIVNDSRGRILLVNAAAERILGTRSESIIGQDVRNLFTAFSLRGRNEALAAMDSLTANPLLEEALDPQAIQTVLEMDNKVVSAHLAPVMTRDEEFLGIVTVFRDITKEVEADRAKSEFVSTVSHELRTPMTSIKGYTDLLHAGAVGLINEEQKRFLGIIKSNADRLTALINDLLDISRIESGRIRLDFKPLRIEEIVLEVVNSLKGQFDGKGLELSLDIPSDLGQVNGDHDRVTQILTNLLSNACQYTPSGGKIAVFLSSMDGTIRVDVTDTGIGIAAEDQSKIFDRFWRADHPVVKDSGGTGLGLAIVKMFVEMHGGRIWVDSELGKGSTFTFILPVMDEAKPEEEPAEEVILESADKVLVVDDDMDIVNLLQEALGRYDFTVEVATDGYEAMAAARRQKPRLILLDLKMPGMDGYEALSRLKRDASTQNVPVLVMSGHVDDEEVERQKLLAAGADGLLLKPFAMQQLIGCIEQILAAGTASRK